MTQIIPDRDVGRVFSPKTKIALTIVLRNRYWSKGCALLSCLLGLTWILGVFVVNQDTIFMAYLFNIFNTLQVCSEDFKTIFFYIQELIGNNLASWTSNQFFLTDSLIFICYLTGPIYICLSLHRGWKGEASFLQFSKKKHVLINCKLAIVKRF